MKLDLDGQVIWQESIAAAIVDPLGSYPIQVIETSDGGYVAAVALNIDQASWVIKLDVDGNPLWSTRFANNNHLDRAIDLLEDVDASLVAAGVSLQTGRDGQVMVTRVNADGSQPGDCFPLFDYTNTIVRVSRPNMK